MDYYAGLDVSLKEISICVVDEGGRTVARGVCPADPEGVAGWFCTRLLWSCLGSGGNWTAA